MSPVDNDVRILFEEFPLPDEVTIPITKALEETLHKHFEDFAVVSNNVLHNIDEPARRVDAFSHSSEYSDRDIHEKKTPLTLAQAKAYILKNHWKTQYVGNSYIDELGRINCFNSYDPLNTWR
jgi:hypothetical protein